jgi:prepilin-type N-terminal cleavage/methylation domain-containing protein
MNGYTLLELLIVLSILAILGCIASPDFKACYHHLKTEVAIRTITREILLARSLAISQQQRSYYCTSSGNDDWRQARIIKTQDNRVWHHFRELPRQYQLFLRNSLHQNNCITFTPLGFTLEERGSFYLTTPNKTVRLILSLSGNLRIVAD